MASSSLPSTSDTSASVPSSPMPVVDGALVHEATSPIEHGHASVVHDDEAYARSIAMMEQGVHHQSSDTTTWFDSMVANGGSGNDTEMQIIHDEEMARSLSFAEAGTSLSPKRLGPKQP